MNYVISDIHGCYKQYLELLEKIKFSEQDTLYILGDVVDRGPEPIKILQDMMKRQNVIYIMGNHDFLAYCIIGKIINVANNKMQFTKEDIKDYRMWMSDGGTVTKEQLLELEFEEQVRILEYISKAYPYKIVTIEEKKYVLVHGGIENFTEEKDMKEYDLCDFIECRIDYSKRYFKDSNTYLVTGHTPTFFIKGQKSCDVFLQNGHIAVDCGCVYGGKLAAYCLENGLITYVDGA